MTKPRPHRIPSELEVSSDGMLLQADLAEFLASEDYLSISSDEFLGSDDYLDPLNDPLLDSSRFSENAVFGYRLFLNNLNYAKAYADHLSDKNQPRLLEDALMSDDLDIAPTAVPGYVLLKRWGPLTLTLTILYRGKRTLLPPDAPVVVHDLEPGVAASEVIVRLLPNLMKNFSVTRLINEWWVTLGLNPPTAHRVFTNPDISNACLPANDPETPIFSPGNPRTSLPVTLPRGLPGILYPVQVALINVPEEDYFKPEATFDNYRRVFTLSASNGLEPPKLPVHTPLINDLALPEMSIITGTAQKRFALVYPDNNYVTLYEHYVDMHPAPGMRRSSRALLALLVPVVAPDPSFVVLILDDVISVVKTLSMCHEFNFVHNGITSYSVVKSESDPLDVRVVGWDFAFSIQPEDCTNGYRKRHLNQTVDILPYISPEVAGEMHESVDYRLDLYLVGVVLYELLTGSVPFSDKNPFKLLRKALTQEPMAPSTVAPWISRQLSDTIMKCLCKQPLRRYQDAPSLVRDLAIARGHYGNPIDSWCLDKCGVPLTILPPRQFFGNRDLRNQLLNDYDRTTLGVAVFFVEGELGLGKTTLINDLKATTIDATDFAIQYLYCELDNLTFYNMFVSIIKVVLANILLSLAEEIARWRQAVHTEVDIHVGFMFEFVPELRQLMGPHYPRADRGVHSVNVEMRFRYGLKQMFCLFASHGMTLYIDNGHHIGPTTFDYMVEVSDAMREISGCNFRCILTYTTPGNGGAGKGVDMAVMQGRLAAVGTQCYQYLMPAIDNGCYREYVSAWLGHDTLPATLALADQLYDKTGGSILKTQFLMLEAAVRGKFRYHKRWDVEFNWNFTSLDDVIANYLQALLLADLRALLQMAVIAKRGNYFHMLDLLVLLMWLIPLVYQLLLSLVEARVIIPASTFYKVPFHIVTLEQFPFDFSDLLVWELAKQAKFLFVHESVYRHMEREMLALGEWSDLHRICGLRFYKRISKLATTSVSEYLVMAIHLLHAVPDVPKEERKTFIQVLVQAGRFALLTCNLELGLQFFSAANTLISDVRLKLKIFITVCQNLYFMQEYSKCLALIEEVRVKYGFDHLIFLLAQVRCLIHGGQIEAGLELAIAGLCKLGINGTLDDERAAVIAERLMSKVPMLIQDIHDLRDLKTTSNPAVLLVYDLIGEAINATYQARKTQVRMLLIAQMLVLMRSHGLLAYCSTTLLAYANSLARLTDAGNYRRAVELARVALHLVTTGDVPLLYVQSFYESYVTSFAIFVENIADVIHQYDVYVANTLTSAPGALNGLHGTVRLFLLMFTELIVHDNDVTIKISNLDRIQVACLQLLRGEFELAEFERVVGNVDDLSVDYQFCVFAARIFYLKANRMYREAADEVFAMKAQHRGLPFSIVHIELYCISYAVMVRFVPRDDAERALADEWKDTVWAFVERWREVNPDNFTQRYKMIDALRASKDPQRDTLEVLDKFEDALDHAMEQNNFYEIGWALHLCATWLIDIGASKKRISRFLELALDAFNHTRFRLMSKVIEKKIREIFVDEGHSAGMPILQKGSVGKTAAYNAYSSSPQLPVEPAEGDIEAIRVKFSKYQVGSIPEEPKQQSPVGRLQLEVIPPAPAAYLPVLTTARRRSSNLGQLPQPSDQVNAAIKACLAISGADDYRLIALNLVENTLRFAECTYGVLVVKKNDTWVLMAVSHGEGVEPLRDETLLLRRDLCPYLLVTYVSKNVTVVLSIHDPVFFRRFVLDDYYTKPPPAVVCVPLVVHDDVLGVLYLERGSEDKDPSRFSLVKLFAMQAAVLLAKTRLYHEMDRAKKAAEDASAEKALFLSNMSHEIRTPFNSLLACSLFLLDTKLTPNQEEYVRTIKQSAMVTLNIIDGILAFSKIEHGLFMLDNAPFALNECIELAIQLSCEQAAANNVQLVFINRCPRIDTVMGDVTRFRQIVINLVGNAVKFTPAGHIEVCVRAKPIVGDRYEIVVSVEDTGIGIAEHQRNKVFGAFSQVDGLSRRVHGGLGLGLAISKKLGDIMGGSITFDSEEGVGLTFYFTLSAQVKLLDGPEFVFDRTMAEMADTTNRVLVVDSNEYHFQALRTLLEQMGMEAEVEPDFAKAKARGFDAYLIAFIHHDHIGLLLSTAGRCQTVIIVPFGQPISPAVSAYPVLFYPFQRGKVINVVRKLVLERTQVKPPPEPKPQPPPLSHLGTTFPLRILLAEDNPVNTKVALTHLKRLGYAADHAKDGVEALEMCQLQVDAGEPLYDLILMDIQMPRMDGIAATIELKRRLREQGLAPEIPRIVALTANVAGNDKLRSMECGMVDFISKPILPKNLATVIERCAREIHQAHG